jgi:hypothetical protein
MLGIGCCAFTAGDSNTSIIEKKTVRRFFISFILKSFSQKTGEAFD